MLIYTLLVIGLFLLFAPSKYQSYLPIKVDASTRQILGCFALLIAYYYYNGEKLF
jgi:small basic protein